jgi:hypothetical protein
MRRRHTDRLVEHDPAIDVALLALFLFLSTTTRPIDPLPRLRERVGEGISS